jgi:hypothetical protein
MSVVREFALSNGYGIFRRVEKERKLAFHNVNPNRILA